MPTDPPPDPDPVTIEATILDLVRGRGVGKTICPSEAARRLARAGRHWRALMPVVREVAMGLQGRGAIVATRRGRVVDLRDARGPIRLGLPPAD